MFVERLLPAAHEHLATVGDDAPVIEAAKLLGGAHINLVIVCILFADLAATRAKDH